MNVAKLVIDAEAFRQLLHLPANTRIHGSMDAFGKVMVMVNHPDIADVAPGAEPPEIAPRFRGSMKSNVEFVSWS